MKKIVIAGRLMFLILLLSSSVYPAGVKKVKGNPREVTFCAFLVKVAEEKETVVDWSKVVKHCDHESECFQSSLRSLNTVFVLDSVSVANRKGFENYMHLPFPVLWRILDRDAPFQLYLNLGHPREYYTEMEEHSISSYIPNEGQSHGDWNAQYIYLKLNIICVLELFFSQTPKYFLDQNQIDQVERWRGPVTNELKRRMSTEPQTFSDWALKAAMSHALNTIDTSKKAVYPSVWESQEFKEWSSKNMK